MDTNLVPIDESCTTNPTEYNAYLGGCLDMLAPSAIPALAITTGIVVVFQLAGVILSFCLAKKVVYVRTESAYELTHL